YLCASRQPRSPRITRRRRRISMSSNDASCDPTHLLVLALLLALCTMASAARAGERNTPTAGRSGRSVVLAPHGMVATSHPLAAQAGLDVLKKGGNAIDAAIATNAALGLMEPMSCGIGGDLYAIVWDAKTQKLYGLNASGRSPYKATRAVFASKGLDDIPTTGPLSWSVPGCVDGWDELRRRFGTMSFDELLGPSIRYAVWELPPPGQGIAALQMLNILEGYDLRSMGPESPDYWHLLVEAKKLAFADRARFYADSAFAQVPTAELISKSYADGRRKLI